MSFILSTCTCEADGYWGGSRVLMSSAYGRKMALKPDAAKGEPLWPCAGLFNQLWAEGRPITRWRHLYFSLVELFFLRRQGHKSRRVVSARDAATQGEHVPLDALRQQGREQTRAAWDGNQRAYHSSARCCSFWTPSQTKTFGQRYLSPRPPQDRWRQPVGYGGELWASSSVWIRSGTGQDFQTSWWRSPRPPPSLSASCHIPTGRYAATSKETYGATRKSALEHKTSANQTEIQPSLTLAESVWWVILGKPLF